MNDTVKAVVCETLGTIDQLVLREDWPLPSPGDDEVLIQVHTAALNFPDLLMLEGKYQVRPELPFVTGGEAAGTVVETGATVTDFAPGDQVIVMGSTGAFATRMVARTRDLLPMPKGLGWSEAAGVGIAYLTAYYALKQRGNLRPGETLLVMGAAGGVGLAAVQIGKLLGARVIAAAGSDAKLDAAREQGADEVINYSAGEFRDSLRAVAGKQGIDVILDSVGGSFAEPAVRSMAWNGRYLVVGFAAGDIPRIPIHLCLLKGCAIIGVSSGEFPLAEPDTYRQLMAELWEHFAAGRLKPVVGKVFALADFREAYRCMAQRRAIGKIVLDMAG